MPPRKSNTSVVSTEDGGAPAKESGSGVEEYNLPRTMVQRLSKGVLPPNTQIQKDALLAISKSATVFINYLSSHAMETAQRQNKKTIQPKDVFDAIHETEFGMFLPRLQGELEKYNTVQCDKRNTYRRKIRTEQKEKQALEASQSSPTIDQTSTEAGAEGSSLQATHQNNNDENSHDDSTISLQSVTNGHGRDDDDDDVEPASKKLRRENGDISDNDATGDEGLDEEEDVPDEEEEEEEGEEGDEEGFESAREELLVEDGLEEREGMDVDDEDEGEDSD